MDIVNYTSLPTHILKSKKTHSGTLRFIITCLGSFIGGAALVLFFYIGALTINGNKPLTYKSNATEPQKQLNGLECMKNNIMPPANISASVQRKNVSVPINNGDSIKSLEPIMFTWDPVPDAIGYYVTLSSDSAKFIDPVTAGTRVFTPQITFKSLMPKTDYKLFLRSVSKTGNITLLYPTPYNCFVAIPALSQFELKTE